MPWWRVLMLALGLFVLPACWEASKGDDPALVASGTAGGGGTGGGPGDDDDDDDDGDHGGGWHGGHGGGHNHHGHDDDDDDDRVVAGWFASAEPNQPDGIVIVLQGTSFVAYNRDVDGVRRWTSSDARTWTADAHVILDPAVVPDTVLVHDGTWWMWYTRQGARPSIGLATSSDGLSWTLRDGLLEGGPPGAWDALGVRRPSVLFDGTRFRMIYTGLRDGAVPLGSAGYAESPDGVNWARHPGPVLQSPCSVNDAWMIRDGEVFRLWYDCRPVRAPAIHQATSVDGMRWTDDGVVLTSDGTRPDYERPFVMRLDGRLRMWLRYGMCAEF